MKLVFSFFIFFSFIHEMEKNIDHNKPWTICKVEIISKFWPANLSIHFHYEEKKFRCFHHFRLLVVVVENQNIDPIDCVFDEGH